MARKPRLWIVTPHGPLQQLDDNLWIVESTVPGTPMQRRMEIIRRSDGTLMFYQAVPVDDATLAQIRALGTPSVLIVPHDQHGMDAPAFAETLGVKIYGPKANEAKLRSKFNLAGTLEDIAPDSAVTVESVAGAKNGEAVAIVNSQNGVSLIFADAYMANPVEGAPFFMRLLGFTGGPKVVPLFRLLFCNDKKALQAHFERLAALPRLKRLIPCHGSIESNDAAGTLKRVAATL